MAVAVARVEAPGAGVVGGREEDQVVRDRRARPPPRRPGGAAPAPARWRVLGDQEEPEVGRAREDPAREDPGQPDEAAVRRRRDDQAVARRPAPRERAERRAAGRAVARGAGARRPSAPRERGGRPAARSGSGGESRASGARSACEAGTPVERAARRVTVAGAGSSASRRPSPRRLNPSTASMMARPGNTARWGASSRFWRPSFSIAPHDGVGGWAERPRNESDASVRIAHESAMLVWTTSTEARFGRMWRPTMPPGRRAERAARLDELALLEGEHRAPDDAGEDRRVHDRDREDHVGGMRPERRDDAEGEEHGREGEEHVHDPHEDLIDAAARVAGERGRGPCPRRARPGPRRRRPRARGARRGSSRARRSRPKTSAPRGSAQLGPAIRSCGTMRSGLGKGSRSAAGADDQERAHDQEAGEGRAVPHERDRHAGERAGRERRPRPGRLAGRRGVSPAGSGDRASHRARRRGCWSPRRGSPRPAPFPGPGRSRAG